MSGAAQRRRWGDWVALVLLVVGGIVFPVVGWLAGITLLWLSGTWSVAEKALGTLVPVELVLLPVVAFERPGRSCARAGCARGGAGLLTWAFLALLVLAAFATVALLARRVLGIPGPPRRPPLDPPG